MTVFDTIPLQRLSQAELRLPFALMRPGNLSFSWKSYAEQVGFHRPSEHCVNPCINVFHRAYSYAQCLVINTGTPVQKLQLYNWQLNVKFLLFLPDKWFYSYLRNDQNILSKYENITEWQKVQKYCMELSIILSWTRSELEWKCCKKFTTKFTTLHRYF